MNLDRVKNYIAKNKPVIAIAIVATATIAAVVIDVALRDEPVTAELTTEN